MSNHGNQEEIVTVTGTESNDAGLQDTNIKEKLGKMIGINKGNIKAKFKQAQKVLLSKMKAIILQVATGAITEKVSSSMCERMDSINSLRNRLNSFASKIAGVISKLLSTMNRLLGPVAALLRIVQVILTLPIPTAVPPGIGIPLSVATSIDNIRQKILKIVAMISQIVNSIKTLTQTLEQALGPAMSILNKINEVVEFAGAYCELLAGLPDEDPSPEFLESLDEAEQALSDALGLIQAELDGLDSEGFDDIMIDLVDIFTEMEASDLIPEGIKSRLRRRMLLGDFNDNNNPGVGSSGGGVIGTDQFGNEIGGGGSGDGTGVGSGGGVGTGGGVNGGGFGTGPDGQPLGGEGNTGTAGLPPNSELFTAVDGNVYLLKVEDDPTSPLIARRRSGAAAQWNNGDIGAVVLKSPLTFTTSSRVILDDIKIRLNTQLALL